MLTDKQKKSLEAMTEQFVVAAQEKYNIIEEDRLEKVLQGSVLKKNKAAMEYSIAHMRRVLA